MKLQPLMENYLLKTIANIRTSVALAAFAIFASYLLVYRLFHKELTSNQLLISIFFAIVLFVLLVFGVAWIEYLKGKGSSINVKDSEDVTGEQSGKSSAEISGSKGVSIKQKN